MRKAPQLYSQVVTFDDGAPCLAGMLPSVHLSVCPAI